MSARDEPLDDELDPDELAALEGLLGNDAVWAEPPAGLEDAVVAAITAEAGAGGVSAPSPGAAHSPAPAPPTPAQATDDNVMPLRRRLLAVVGVAAAVVIAVFGVTVTIGGGDDPQGRIVELAATDLAPGASAEADVIDTPSGVKILLDVSGLPPAPDGGYYQAWVRNEEGGVSAGTFHLRGGDSEIELWSGVPIDDYPLITVTVQREGEGTESSGEVVLRGEISPS